MEGGFKNKKKDKREGTGAVTKKGLIKLTSKKI